MEHSTDDQTPGGAADDLAPLPTGRAIAAREEHTEGDSSAVRQSVEGDAREGSSDGRGGGDGDAGEFDDGVPHDGDDGFAMDEQQQQHQQEQEFGDQPEHHEDPEAHYRALVREAAARLPQTLLNYDDPVQIRSSSKGHRTGPSNCDPESGSDNDDDLAEALAQFVPPLILHQGAQLSGKPVVTTTDKILFAVLPPRTVRFVDERAAASDAAAAAAEVVVFAQTVSRRQATRPDIEDLTELLKLKLHEAKARTSVGLCPVRSAIYAMLADELLRQVTIDQPERGLLLRRVRDEAHMTADAYRSLCEAASEYGGQKLLEGARGTPDLVARIAALTDDTAALRREVRRLEARHASLQRSEAQAQADTKRYAEEKAFLESTRKRLQQHLDTVKQLQEQERRALAAA